MGWATITHPYHPLRGQRFRVLKARLVAGQPTLILQGTAHGSLGVLREWTDQDLPQSPDLASEPAPVLELSCLLELAQWAQARLKPSAFPNKTD